MAFLFRTSSAAQPVCDVASEEDATDDTPEETSTDESEEDDKPEADA